MVADPEQEVRSLAKKVLWILFAVVLVLALAVAGVTGYFWYQNNHIFVEDAVYPINAKTLDLRGQDISFEHYNAVHSQLPQCQIYWDVPFQGSKYPNDTVDLIVSSLTEEDVQLIKTYFPNLKPWTPPPAAITPFWNPPSSSCPDVRSSMRSVWGASPSRRMPPS